MMDVELPPTVQEEVSYPYLKTFYTDEAEADRLLAVYQYLTGDDKKIDNLPPHTVPSDAVMKDVYYPTKRTK